MTGVEIVRADHSDAELIANLIGVAFHPLAVAEWLVADLDDRARVLPANFLIYVEHALVHGLVELTTDHNAAAVWFPTGVDDLPPPADYDARLLAACGRHTERFRLLDEQFAAHHPHDLTHHHLAFLAVRPDAQGNGLGSALLRAHHNQLDASGIAAYLEASSPRSVRLYERHGYRHLGPPFHLPDNGPPLWPMLRQGPAHPTTRQHPHVPVAVS